MGKLNHLKRFLINELIIELSRLSISLMIDSYYNKIIWSRGASSKKEFFSWDIMVELIGWSRV